MIVSHKHNRFVGIIATACLGLSMLAVAAVPASAEGKDPEFGNIDQGAKGSITIIKQQAGSRGGVEGAVDRQDSANGVGVAGVKFKAYKINEFDVANNDSWSKMASFSKQNQYGNACADPNKPVLEGYTLAEAKETPVTDSNGKAKLSELDLGAYLLCESQAPRSVVKKAAPFIVTIPFPDHGKTNKWIYDIHVYPKNVVSEAPQKHILVTGFGIGSTSGDSVVTYSVSKTIPSIGERSSFKYFIVEDEFAEEHSNEKVKSVKIEGGPDFGKNDYTVSEHDSKTFVSLTKTGLEKLKVNPNKKFVVEFQTNISKLSPDGRVFNQANFYFDIQDVPTPPTIPPTIPPTTPPTTPPGEPTNKVVSTWGEIKVLKFDENEAGSKLKGAQFQVFVAKEPFAETCSSKEFENAPISVNGKTIFESGNDGIVNIPGLFVDSAESSGADSEPVLKHAHRCYVLKEIAAPAGFVLPVGDQALTSVKVETGKVSTSSYNAKIPNAKSTVPDLPLTGTAGRVLLAFAGVALLAIATGVAFVQRRRSALR